MNTNHKFEEQREKNRIYENSNVVVTSTPNEADLISDIQDYETGGRDVAFVTRMPDDNLYKYLQNYHKNYGFDIFLNDLELFARSFAHSEHQIFQYGRVDSVSITNLQEKEMIKNVFLNGIYLTQHEYKLTHLSFLELRKQHEDRKAAVAADLLRIQKEKREQDKEDIKEAAKGVEEAKKEFQELEKFKEKTIQETAEQIKKIALLEKEVEECNKTIRNYELEETSKKKELQSKINDLQKSIKGEDVGCVFELKKIKELEASLKEAERSKEQANNTSEELKKEKDKAYRELQSTINQNKLIIEANKRQNEALSLKIAGLTSELHAERMSISGLMLYKATIEESERGLNNEIIQLKTQIQLLERRSVEGVHSEDVENLKRRAAKLDEVNRELVKKKTRLIRLAGLYKSVWTADYLWKNIFESSAKAAYIQYKGKYFYINAKGWNDSVDGGYITDVIYGLRIAWYSNKKYTSFFNLCSSWSVYEFKLLEKKHTINPYQYSNSYKGFSLYFPNESEMRFVTYVKGPWLDELKRALKPIIDRSNEINDLYDEIAQYIIDNDDIISDAADAALEWNDLKLIDTVPKPIKYLTDLIESTEMKHFFTPKQEAPD